MGERLARVGETELVPDLQCLAVLICGRGGVASLELDESEDVVRDRDRATPAQAAPEDARAVHLDPARCKDETAALATLDSPKDEAFLIVVSALAATGSPEPLRRFCDCRRFPATRPDRFHTGRSGKPTDYHLQTST